MKYGKIYKTTGRLQSVEIYEGETIEQKVNRIVNNNEPITDGAPIIFTERKDGVLPEYDIRTDRWDIAITAMDKVNTDRIARRENKADVKDTIMQSPTTYSVPSGKNVIEIVKVGEGYTSLWQVNRYTT